MLQFDVHSMSLAIFIDNMIEFFQKQSVCGVDNSHFREFSMFIGQLPPKYKHYLMDAMRIQMNSSRFYDSCNRVPSGCKRDGWLLFCTQVFTSVSIRIDSALASSGTPSIRPISTELHDLDSKPQIQINPVQQKQYPCFLCQESHKFLRCPHIEVKLKNEKYRSQFDKVYPPSSSPQVAAISNDEEELQSISQDNTLPQDSVDDVVSSNNGFDDDIIDNSRNLYDISSEFYCDDPSCFDDDREVMLQLYPVQHYPVCTHCQSFEHPPHLCPVVSVEVADVADGYDNGSFDGGEICIHAIDKLSSGEDGTSLVDNVVSLGDVVSSMDGIVLAGEDTAAVLNVSGEDTAAMSTVTVSADLVPAV